MFTTDRIGPGVLAAHANMSVRTFTRRFRDEAGTTPVQLVGRAQAAARP
ncbi:hypothetical protein AB0I68_38945 [Streptomyces sp. NPDC050448]